MAGETNVNETDARCSINLEYNTLFFKSIIFFWFVDSEIQLETFIVTNLSFRCKNH